MFTTTMGNDADPIAPVKFNRDALDAHFPFDHYRAGQREAIEFTIDAFNDGKDIVILEAPTGAGKSGVGYTVMDMVDRAYYLTVTKILQDQLVTEFGDKIIELRGRGSYPCTWYERYGPKLVAKKLWSEARLRQVLAADPNCGEGYCRADCPPTEQISTHKCKRCFPISDNPDDKKGGSLRVLPDGMQHSACPYYEQVYKATNGRKVVMNFSSFLYQTQMTNRFDAPRDLAVIDECFHPRTMIQTDCGRIPIGKLVNESMRVRVKSYNTTTGQIEYKWVTRWLKRDKQMTYRVLAGNRVLYPTADHKIYTPYGKVKLGRLRVGDLVITDEVEINQRQRQVVLGSLLGDAAIHVVESKRVSKKYVNQGTRARVRFRHGPKQEAYINWKYQLMQPHAKTKPTLKPSQGYTKKTLSFSTSCDFYDVAAVTLVGDRKKPTTDWLCRLDDFGLAIWYMDDGSLSGGVANFHTEGFTRDECETIAGWLIATYGFPARVLDAKMKDGRIHHYISIGRDGAQMLARRIAKYVPPFMRYKLPEPGPVERLACRTEAYDGWLVGGRQYHRVEYSKNGYVSGDIILLGGSDWRAADAFADEIGGQIERVTLDPDGTVWRGNEAASSMVARTGLVAERWDQYDDSIERETCEPVSAHPIRSIEPYKETVTYDLEVADNHNYFAGATLVSNCHNLEPLLLDFVSMSMDDRLLRRAGVVLPHFQTALEYAIWFADHQIDLVLRELFGQSKKWVDAATDNRARQDALREQDELGRLLRKYKEFMDHMTGEQEAEWIVEVEDLRVGGNGWRRITLKPVLVHNFVHDLIFRRARKILMMSATVLDVAIVCESLGIDRSRVAAYRMKNRFPVEQRPIYLETCSKITGGKAKMGEWGPKMVTKIDELVGRYPNQRGIIHTHNFAIAEMLLDGCQSDVSDRFTYQKRYRDKHEMLQHHAERSDSIIVAPAMHEGVNLVDDLSRLQIICKVPYPNHYEDKQLARRMEIDGRYYDWLTALKLVQSYGRSIRSEQDWADTYIIDATIRFFLQKSGKLLPSWFLEAIHDSPKV